ncbi:hypothetical protein V2J09_015591 [Rumex salicifolius]
MPAKRSRLMGSASTGDAEFVTPPPASQDIWRQPRTPMIKPAEFSTSSTGKSKSADQARPPIFSITSTVYEQPFTGGESAGGIDNIFDKCYYCNKKIREDGDFHASLYRSTNCKSNATLLYTDDASNGVLA